MGLIRIDITVELDPIEGWTLENAQQYDGYELRLLMKSLPGAVKAVRKEVKRQKIERRCKALEKKPVWTWREALWYAWNANKVRPDSALDEAINRYEMFREQAEAD